MENLKEGLTKGQETVWAPSYKGKAESRHGRKAKETLGQVSFPPFPFVSSLTTKVPFGISVGRIKQRKERK